MVLLETRIGSYRWREGWCLIPPTKALEANGRTHGAAIDRNSRLYVFHQEVPAMLVYDRDGHLLKAWGQYPGAHGLTLVEEQGEEFLWLTDQKRAVVEKTDLEGAVVQQLSPPPYADREPYIPTWVAVNEVRYGGNGDIWVADGYGSHRVSRFDAAGNFLAVFDGTEGAGEFSYPHGIWFDSRKAPMELYIADRGNRRVQVYNPDGVYLRVFGDDFLTSPDGFVLGNNYLVVPELRGRITLLDANDNLICHLGNNESICTDPSWPNLTPLLPGKFNSPHAAATDDLGNIYVVEWRVGGRIVKLEILK